MERRQKQEGVARKEQKSSAGNDKQEKGKERKESKVMCLGDYVARCLKHARYSVVHALLASLPVQEV